MDREYLSAIALFAYGVVLIVLYLVQGIGSDWPAIFRIGPFTLIAFAIAYSGFWLLQEREHRAHAEWVLAWTVGGATTFMALAVLVVLNHWVAVASTEPAARTILDTVTGGSLAGTVAGLYDARSRQRYAALQVERDRIERLANKAESLNRYARALNESSHIDEISGLSLEVVQLLIGSRDAAFLLVDGDGVRTVDSTIGETDSLDAVAREVADSEPMETVRCPEETQCDLPTGGDIEAIIAVPVPASQGRTAVLLAVPEEPGAYTAEDLELLELLAAHMATALPDIDPGAVDPPAP